MICRICDSNELEPVLDLGNQPWCNHFLKEKEVGKEPSYPLRLIYCHSCSAAQLDHTVAKEVMFGDHTYLSGVTRSLGAHFAEVARCVDEEFFQMRPGKSVLDIGSNDGTQLKHFQALGYEVLGVESSKTTAAIAEAAGVPTVNAFFNADLAQNLGKCFDVINAAGVFFHLEELHSVTEGIREALREDGVFVLQFLYMKSIVENGAFDQIYHEHLLYYTLRTVEVLLSRHGLEMFDARLFPIHGGSIVAYVGHRGRRAPTDRLEQMRAAEDATDSNAIESYQRFARRTEQMKVENLAFLERARTEKKIVMGMGAPVKGNTMLNYFGVGPELMQCLVEKNVLRKGLFAPGSHLPVVMEDELDEPPDIYFVLAWNFKSEILQNNQLLLAQGVEFYFPVDPKEVDP